MIEEPRGAAADTGIILLFEVPIKTLRAISCYALLTIWKRCVTETALS